MIGTVDFSYMVAGAGLMGLTFLAFGCGKRSINVPVVYVIMGALLVFSPIADLIPDPLGNEGDNKLIEHLTELIVIISLATAGLAVDRKAGAREWQHSWMLLGATMPLTIVAIYLLGIWAGLGVSAAMLLAASLAPTDPVLARSVQVEGPNKGDQDDVRLSLTTEAGLNDGLAFPFVWLAIAFAASGATTFSEGIAQNILQWLTLDMAWRLIAGIVVGWLTGYLMMRYVHGRFGAMAREENNAGLVLLGSTFLAYGCAEAVEGYGFLAVFVAARVGRVKSDQLHSGEFIEEPHGFGEQAEKILLVLLLLWLGAFCASGALSGLTWQEAVAAGLIVFIVRPLAGYLPLLLTRGTSFQRITIAFFGIRGMGTIFYITFAMATIGADAFGNIEGVWRIALLTILISIAVHGALAPIAMRRVDEITGKETEPA